MRITGLLLLFALLGASTGCSLIPEQIDLTENWSASKFYSEAKKSLSEGDFEEAIKYYELLESRFPFGKYAQQAQVEIAYAYYKYDEPESALAAADRFIKLHPRHPHVDYLYFLKGLVNFNAGKDLISKYVPQDPTRRDPGAARAAFDDFSILVRKFPNSKYSADARQRMLFLRNNLAEYEIHVANYYMRRGAYVAAANRAKYVVENYQRTTAVPKALALMATAYKNMGLDDLSHDALRVLKINQPDHPAVASMALPVTIAETKAPVATPVEDSQMLAAPAISAAVPQTLAVTETTEEVPAAQTIPEEDAPVPPIMNETAPTADTATINNEDWLLSQPAAHYTVQVYYNHSAPIARDFAIHHNLVDKASIYRTDYNGRPLYVVLYGSFPDAASAKRAIETLPGPVREYKPWVRNMSAVHTSIKKARIRAQEKTN